ncbi:MAG TPA: DUF885 domain-containing protein [Vicinamibacteria bacterium]
MTNHRFPRGKALVAALGAAIAVTAAAQTPPLARKPPLAAFFDSFADEWMRRQPSSSTGSRYFEGETQDALDRQLTPQSEAFQAETVALARRGLSELAQYEGGRLSDTERVSAQVMRWQLQTQVDAWPYRDYQFPLQQMSGANVNLPNLMTVVHPVRSVKDAESYLARLRLIDERMAEATELSAQRAGRGIRPPRFILQATIAQMRQFVSSASAANPLVTTFAERLDKVEGLDASARRTLVEQAAAIVEAEVYPAWKKAIAVLEEQLPEATDDAGLWRFKEGPQVYADRLRQFTSTGLGAQEIHDIGLREVARLEGEMDRILRTLGRTEGSVKERMAQLKDDLAYPDDAQGRARIMADIETLIRDAERRSDALFDLRPKAAVIAQPYPEYRWSSAAASYTAPPLDGSRPGVYQMPLRRERLTKLGLRTLVYHETVPGHHFQIALSVENRGVPKFRQTGAFGGTSAFSEGWALYAERLAAEERWYECDPEGLLGQLDAELFRARRLVVDTGLHALRWTRQQAIDYGIEASEVERYVVMPGQATAYKIGQLEIIRLRDKARSALGSRFDPRQFHNRVLLTGSVPLTLLEREVDAYIRSPKAAD